MTYPHGGASEIWRDGAGGAYQPKKPQIRDWGRDVEGRINSLEQVGVSGAQFASGGPVACATTSNITLSGEQTIDGMVTSASRVLVKDQTAPEDNGIYLTAAGAWSRATDMDTAGEVRGAAVFVSGGSANGGKSFATYSTVSDLNTDAIDWLQINSNSGVQDQIDALDGDVASAVARQNADGTALALEGKDTGAAAVLSEIGGRLLVKDTIPDRMFAGSPADKITISSSGNASYFGEDGQLRQGEANKPRFGFTRFPCVGDPGLIVEDQRSNNARQSRGLHITHHVSLSWGGTGADAFTDGETVTATGGGTGVYRADRSNTSEPTNWTFAISGGSGVFTGTLTGATSGKSRPISGSAVIWAATNATVSSDQAGMDGVVSAACSILADAANATVLQSLTQSSAQRVFSAYVRRLVGSGAVEMTTDGGATWTEITLTDGWALCEVSQTLANPEIGFRLTTSGDKIAVDLTQSEAGDHASSPIITKTGGLSRSADMPHVLLSDLPFDASEGSIYIEAISDRALGQVRYAFSLDDGSDADRIYAALFNNVLGGVYASSAQQANNSVGQPAAFELQRIAMSWVADDIRTAVAGLLSQETSATVPTGLTHLRLGTAFVAGSNLSGRITRLVYLPGASSSADMLEWSVNGYPFERVDTVRRDLAVDIEAERDRITQSARWRGLAAGLDRTRRADMEAGLTHFVSSGLGDDANNGSVRSRAKQTVAGVVALNPAAGESIGLAHNGYWRETLKPTTNLSRIAGYGVGDVPVLDGAEVIAPGDFSLSAHGDAGGVTYEVSLVGDANGDVGNNDSIMLWEGGAWLIRRASVADVAANPGSFYLPSPYISNSNPLTPRLAYVHPFASTNPTIDGKTYEYSKRNLLIQLAGQDKPIVEGVHVKRGASDYGSIASATTGRDPVLRRVLSSYGGKHNTVLSDGTLEDFIAFDCEVERVLLADGGAIPITFYAPDASGLEFTVRRSMVIYPDGRNTSGFGPLYAHASGTLATLHEMGRIEAFIAKNSGALSADVKNLIADDYCTLNVLARALNFNDQRESIMVRRALLQHTESTINSSIIEKNAAYAADLTFTDGCIMSNVGSGGSPGAFYQMDITDAEDTAIDRNFFYRAGPLGGNVRVAAASAGSTFRGNIVVVNESGASRYVYLGGGFDVDYNVYVNLDGASGKFWQDGSGSYSTLAAWNAATGYDANSVLLSPEEAATLFVGDPRDGDFRLNPDCTLAFGDGAPIIGNAGPRQFYDWGVHAVIDGQPRAWPTPPATEAECEAYIADPWAWRFYP